jgi:hypothetical protein
MTQESMPVCEIFLVANKRAILWKWRYLSADGRVDECKDGYGEYFQCVSDARAKGYEPKPNWTGPLMLSPVAA